MMQAWAKAGTAKSLNRYYVFRDGRMVASPHVWHPSSTDMKTQVTTARSTYPTKLGYSGWDHVAQAHDGVLRAARKLFQLIEPRMDPPNPDLVQVHLSLPSLI